MQGTALNGAKTSSITMNSPYDYLMRGEGIRVSKVHTVDGNGAQLDAIFTLTGCVDAILWGEVTSKTNSTTCSTCYYDLYDATAAYEITDNTGLDMSACIVGDIVAADADATSKLSKISCATGAVDKGASGAMMYGLGRILLPFRIIKKSGATTQIRFCFTGDANTNLQITHYVRYLPVSGDGALVAA